MKYYQVELTYDLPNGDQVVLNINNVEGKNQSDVISRIPAILEYIDKNVDSPQVEAIKNSSHNPYPDKIVINPVPAPPPVDESRFILQHSDNLPDGWVLTDTENGVVITFKEHHFNDSQNITWLNGTPSDYLVVARIMREIGDWLAKYHKEIS